VAVSIEVITWEACGQAADAENPGHWSDMVMGWQYERTRTCRYAPVPALSVLLRLCVAISRIASPLGADVSRDAAGGDGDEKP